MITITGTGRVLNEPELNTQSDTPRLNLIVGASDYVNTRQEDGSYKYGYQNVSLRVTLFGNNATGLVKAGVAKGSAVSFTGTPANFSFFKPQSGEDRPSLDLQFPRISLERQEGSDASAGQRLTEAVKRGVVQRGTAGLKSRAAIPANPARKAPQRDAELADFELEEELTEDDLNV